MWTFQLDLKQSCIRKRNEAAEDLLHYILDSVDCPKELDQATVFRHLKILEKAQDKIIEYSPYHEGKDNYFLTIARALEDCAKAPFFSKLGMIELILSFLPDNSSFKIAIETKIHNATCWQNHFLDEKWE